MLLTIIRYGSKGLHSFAQPNHNSQAGLNYLSLHFIIKSGQILTLLSQLITRNVYDLLAWLTLLLTELSFDLLPEHLFSHRLGTRIAGPESDSRR